MRTTILPHFLRTLQTGRITIERLVMYTVVRSVSMKHFFVFIFKFENFHCTFDML
jgi:hypothetical protein